MADFELPPNTVKDSETQEALTRSFIRERTLFGEKMGSEFAGKRSSLNVVVDMGEDFEIFSKAADELDVNSFERFIDGLSDDFGIPKHDLEQNQELREAFLELKEMELDTGKRHTARKRYFDLKQKISLILAGYVGENTEVVRKFYDGYTKLEKDRYITGRIFSLAKSGDPKLLKMVEGWRTERRKLDEEYERGGISEEDYLVKRDVINEKAVKESGDKSLQDTWSVFNQDEAYADAQEVIPDDSNEKPVTDKEQLQGAFAEIDSQGLPFDFHDDGSVSIVLGEEKFPIDVFVFKNDKTDQFVYYIVDSYSDDGIVKVDFATNLMDALDQRYIDAYLSSKIGEIPGEVDSPSDIPDQYLVGLCEKLIGKGHKRGYKIRSEDKAVLDALVPVLMMKDEKYSGFYDRVRVLSEFIETEEDANFISKRLLAGDVNSLQDLLGESA